MLTRELKLMFSKIDLQRLKLFLKLLIVLFILLEFFMYKVLYLIQSSFIQLQQMYCNSIVLVGYFNTIGRDHELLVNQCCDCLRFQPTSLYNNAYLLYK